MGGGRTWKCLAFAAAIGLPIAVVETNGAGAQTPPVYAGVDISNDGNIVAFATTAALVPQDGNGQFDVYVLDRRNGNLLLASVAVNGRSGNGASNAPSLSPEGGWVAFESTASNLVSGDTNGMSDVFLRGMTAVRTVKVSRGVGSAQANGNSTHPDVSARGEFVAFESWATNLVAGDRNGMGDVFRWRRTSAATVLVSVSTNGRQGNLASSFPSISDDGTRIGFATLADNWGQCPVVRRRGIDLSLAVRTVPAAVTALRSYVACAEEDTYRIVDGLDLSGNGTRLLASLGWNEWEYGVFSGWAIAAHSLSGDGRALTDTWGTGGDDNRTDVYQGPSLSPEGRYAVFRGEPTQQDMTRANRMDINTGNFIQLPASVGLSDSATCSSGRLTAFIGSSSGVPGVYLVTWSTGAVIRLM